MSVPAEAAGIHRVVLALEYGGLPPFTLELALGLARRLDAELAATLIENSNLLRAAGFPFTREILRHTGTDRELDAGRLADQLRLGLRRLQADLEARAQAGGVRASFRTLRASGVHAALEPGHSGSSGDLVFYSHPQAPSLAARPPEQRIIVVKTTEVVDDRVESVVKQLLQGFTAGTMPHVQRIRTADSAQIITCCRAARPDLLVVPATLSAAELRPIIERAGCPVLAIG